MKSIELTILVDKKLSETPNEELLKEFQDLLKPFKGTSDSLFYVPLLKVKRIDLKPEQEYVIVIPESAETKDNKRDKFPGVSDIEADYVNEVPNLKMGQILAIPTGTAQLQSAFRNSLIFKKDGIAKDSCFNTIEGITKSIKTRLDKDPVVSNFTILFDLSKNLSSKATPIEPIKKSPLPKKGGKETSGRKKVLQPTPPIVESPSPPIVKPPQKVSQPNKKPTTITTIDIENESKGMNPKKVSIPNASLASPKNKK